MKLFICGQKEFGASVFRQCLAAGHEILGVCSPELNDAGSARDRLTDAAAIHRVPWLPGGSLSAELLPDGIDLIVAAHSHDFIGAATRRKARLGAIGYHPSLLPRHRGRDAVAWAIKMGDAITGGTVYWMDDRIDAGPIQAQDWCWIHPRATAAEMWRHVLFDMGLRLLAKAIADIDRGEITRLYQDETNATWEPACNPPRVRRPDLPRLPGPAGARAELQPCDPDNGYPWSATGV